MSAKRWSGCLLACLSVALVADSGLCRDTESAGAITSAVATDLNELDRVSTPTGWVVLSREGGAGSAETCPTALRLVVREVAENGMRGEPRVVTEIDGPCAASVLSVVRAQAGGWYAHVVRGAGCVAPDGDDRPEAWRHMLIRVTERGDVAWRASMPSGPETASGPIPSLSAAGACGPS